MQRINNKIVILSIIIIFLLLSFYSCSKPEPPKLVLSEESWYYGEVTPDHKPAHHFKIKNEGEEKLIIESVFSPCACVTLDLAGKEVAPGEEATLTATFDPYGYEGHVSKYITVKSNDPKNPEKRIEVNITVLRVPNPDIELSQKTFNLGDITYHTDKIKQTIQFTVFNTGDADLVIEEVVIEDIFSHNLEIPLTISPGEQFQAELSIDISQLMEGEFRKAVRIMTNDPQNQAVFLRITGNVK